MPEPLRVVVPFGNVGSPENEDPNTVSQDPATLAVEEKPATEALIAGKFKSQDDLVKAYEELSKKLGSRETPAPKLTDPITPKPVENAGQAELDLTPFQNEYDQNGKLSEETYQKLQKEYRVGRNLIDEVIASRVAKVQSFQKEVFDSVGGQETFGQMLDWAKGNLAPSEQAAYDKAMASGDPGVIKLAVHAVHSKFNAAFGSDPNLVGGRAGAAGIKPFRSLAELTQAMGDPRYEHDDAFRADVEKRVAISTII
jgi:hypothetical protein